MSDRDRQAPAAAATSTTPSAGAGGAPLVLYVPGLLPKPAANLHREALKRCLVEGVRRVDSAVADRIRASDHGFDLVSWTYDFYLEQRDIAPDRAAIDAVIEQQAATVADIREASSAGRRFTLWLYRTGDLLPFLIPHIASERVELHLRDLHRYLDNRDGAADKARELLKLQLRTAHDADRPVLLVAHSMGSVIAYDALWQLARVDGDTSPVALWLTMGSPLGQRYIQRRLLGRDRSGADRYPPNVRRWINVTAVGDMTAVDPRVAGDFADMVRLGLVEYIRDLSLYGHFRQDGQLNVHSEYGYFANAVTGKVIADWWRAHL
jgi:hypothetical protein